MKDKFSHLKKMFQKYSVTNIQPAGKATAEKEASENPKKFLKRKDLLSFKGKGVAF